MFRIHLLLTMFLFTAPSAAQEPKLHPYKPKQIEGASLSILDGIPVLQLQGSEEQMGKQAGELLKPEIQAMHSQAMEKIERVNMKAGFDIAKLLAQGMAKKFPAGHKQEMDAFAQSAAVPVEMFYIAHFLVDVTNGLGCSDIVIEPGRSKNQKTQFGRNMDFSPEAFPEYCLAMIRKPSDKKKRSFVSIMYPGMVGISSGMNDAGLCVGHNSIYASGDGAIGFSAKGMPTLLLCRQLLEECDSVEAALEWIKKTPSAGRCALMLADKKRGLVVEITTKTVQERGSDKGIAALTNHLRCKGLAAEGRMQCNRWDVIQKATREQDSFDAKDVQIILDKTNQGNWTLHSVLFEPATLTMRLSISDGQTSATKQTYKELNLTKLLAR